MINEEWRPAIYVDRHGNIYDYTGKYEVSNFGNVRSYPKKTYGGIRILKPSHTKEGYAHVSLCNNGKIKPCRVQILVAYAFPEICGDWFVGCDVGHDDCNPYNNVASNLYVCTHKENINHPITLERKRIANIGKTIPQEQREKISNTLKGHFIGEKHPSSKPILEYTKDGIFVREWACAMEVERERGIDHKNISSVCQGKRKSAGGSVWRYKKETD